MDLAVVQASVRAAVAMIEDNADKDDPTGDAETLRRVYSKLLDIRSASAGAAAVVQLRREMLAALVDSHPLGTARAMSTLPPSRLRLVK
jgi:hypothetical protein